MPLATGPTRGSLLYKQARIETSEPLGSFVMSNLQITVPRCLSFVEAAQILGVSKDSVRRRADEGELPILHVGGLPRIDVADLMAYIERQKVAAAERIAQRKALDVPRRKPGRPRKKGIG